MESHSFLPPARQLRISEMRFQKLKKKRKKQKKSQNKKKKTAFCIDSLNGKN